MAPDSYGADDLILMADGLETLDRLYNGGLSTARRAAIMLRKMADEKRQCGPNVPEGWKLVPIKPTDAMIEAQFKCWHDENSGKEAYVAEMYTAMVEACPPFATGSEGSK